MSENDRQTDSSYLVYTPYSESTSNDSDPPLPEGQQTRQTPGVQPPGLPYEFADNRKKTIIVLCVAAAAAIFYAVCFGSGDTLPQLSFTVFCPVVFTALAKTLDALGYLRNRRALLLAAPITLLALMNGIFSMSAYSAVNIAVMHILFAAFILTAVSEGPMDLYSPHGAGRVILTICGSWAVLFRIIKAMASGRGKRQYSGKVGKVFLGLLTAVPLILIIGALLVSADMVFAQVLLRMVNGILDGVGRINGFFIISAFAAFIYCTGYIWRAKAVASRPERPFTPLHADIYVCAPFLAVMNLLFLFFSVIQMAFLFTGGLMKLPGDMVYSQYAREGFFQLLAVTMINFSVIYIFLAMFSDVTGKPALKAMIFALLAFTVVLIASSFYRLSMYIGVYAFTPLRLGVITFLIMELVLAAVTAIKLINPETPFVKRFILTCLVFFIIANVSASGFVSARLNVAMFMSGGAMRWLDVTSSGPDGLTVMKPFLESEDYICRGSLIIRRDEANVPAFFTGRENTYENVVKMIQYKSDAWQNWSLIEYLGRSENK